MITEKMKISKMILEQFKDTRGEKCTGNFLNRVAELVYDGNVDFNEFNTESYVRARRKVLELNPHLDERTSVTKEIESLVKKEVA